MTKGVQSDRPVGIDEVRKWLAAEGRASEHPFVRRVTVSALAELDAARAEIEGLRAVVSAARGLRDRWPADRRTDDAARALWDALDAAAPGAAEPLHEWQCPQCGATTRARMADETERPRAAPDAAVRIAAEAMHGRATPFKAQSLADDVVAALARAGWLHDPAELDAARAEIERLRAERDEDTRAMRVLRRHRDTATAEVNAARARITELEAL